MSHLDRAAVVFAAVFSAAACSAAEFQINTYTAGNQRSASFALGASPAGQFVAVWESGHDGSPNGVFGQRFEADGAPLGGEFLVNTYTSGFQGGPAVAMGAAGDFLVVWDSNHQDGAGFGVFGRRYDAAGSPLGGEFQVANTTANNQIDPTVAALPSGGYVVVWEAWGQPFIGAISIYGRCYDAGGTPLGAEFPVGTTAAFDLEPSVGTDPSGGFVAAWARMNVGTFARRFDDDCVPKGAEFLVDSGFTQPSAVAVGGGGDFLVVWGFEFDGSGSAVAARRYDSGGSPLGAAFQVNTYTPGDQNYPVVAAEPGGGFRIAWESAGQDLSGFAVIARRYDAGGQPTSGEEVVNLVAAGAQSRPAITSSPADTVVAWTSAGQDGDGDGVFARALRCGNGEIDSNEQCDDGNDADGDCCSSRCRFEPDGAACDDANECTEGDTCLNGICGTCLDKACGCALLGDLRCHQSASVCGCTVCGDGRVEPGEQCDDGNTSPGDGCDAGCRLEEVPCVAQTAAKCQGGDRDGLACSNTLSHSDCPPGPPQARCVAASSWFVNDADASPLFTWPAAGEVSIDCGQFDAGSGRDACACNIVSLNALLLPSVGWFCFAPANGCPTGRIDCDGGDPLDIDLVQDHRIGNCGLNDFIWDCPPGVSPPSPECDTVPCGSPGNPNPCQGNAECAAQCDVYCDGLGGDFQVYRSACEGYCQGGGLADGRCQFDLDCAGGTCAGGQAVPHALSCNCQCLAAGGSASRPGALTCNVGVRITVESNLPCDGTDVTTTLGDYCVALTSERATGTLLDADLNSGAIVGELSGTPIGCSAMSAATTGLELGGNLSFFDTGLGDLEVPLRVVCQ